LFFTISPGQELEVHIKDDILGYTFSGLSTTRLLSGPSCDNKDTPLAYFSIFMIGAADCWPASVWPASNDILLSMYRGLKIVSHLTWKRFPRRNAPTAKGLFFDTY